MCSYNKKLKIPGANLLNSLRKQNNLYVWYFS